jgi:hypothetical protein
MKSRKSTETSEYRNDAHKDMIRFEPRILCKIKPMTEEIALEHWNEANRTEQPEEVKQHFKRELQRFR